MARRAHSDENERGARRIEPLTSAVQLHRVVAAVQSAVVAQPDQDGRTIAPEVAQAPLVALVVGQHEIAQRLGGGALAASG
jgi:hypothetical protein